MKVAGRCAGRVTCSGACVDIIGIVKGGRGVYAPIQKISTLTQVVTFANISSPVNVLLPTHTVSCSL